MNVFPKQSERRMVITDLDGTLFQTEGTLSATNLATLEDLGRRQIGRIIATGRSLYSAYKVLPRSFPIDYLIFSSGAGIVDWHTQQLLVAHHLTRQEIALAVHLLINYNVDFMVHKPIPENHYFSYRAMGQENPDFVRRCQRYQAFASPLDLASSDLHKACQILAIDPNQGSQSKYDMIKKQLRTLKVIRSTSPTDGVATWIEIFPPSVSKALASEWLARKHNVNRATILALGNDYNDLDLLQWAGNGFVVRNAPSDLRQTYRTVRSNNEDGFTEAVKIWMNS
jgi:Cof subfamily protein (haloacid dehalogenase superfamily)